MDAVYCTLLLYRKSLMSPIQGSAHYVRSLSTLGQVNATL